MTEAETKQVEVGKLADALAPATERVADTPTKEKPIKEEEETVAKEKLVKEEPATEEKLVKEEPATEEKLVKEEPATEEKLVKEEPATEEKPVKEEPAAGEKKEAATTERRGILSDPSVLPDSNDPDEVRKQVEFYFSDSNLRFDKFLFGLVGKENKWVPLKMVASFKRMQRFKDFATIQTALETSELLEMNPQKTMIKRKVPLDTNVNYNKIKEIQDQAQSRSLYSKGFGKETATTQFDIEKLFEPHGPINAVRLRRDDQRVFKGSVFVEFRNDELMEKFIAMEEKPKYKDQELTYMRKKDYVEMKIQDIKDGKVQAQDRKTYQNKRKQHFDALKLGNGRPDNRGFKNNHDGEKKEKREGGHGGRGGRGRGRGRGSRGGRGGRGGRDRGGDKNGNAADDEHSIPKVQTSGEQGVKRQREEEDNDVGNGEKKVKVEEEAAA